MLKGSCLRTDRMGDALERPQPPAPRAAAGNRAAAMPGGSEATETKGVSCGGPVAGRAQRDAAELARGMVSKRLTRRMRKGRGREIAGKGRCIDGPLPSHFIGHTIAASPRVRARAVRHARPRIERRAQGRPGAGRARGPPADKKAGGSHHRSGRRHPAFPARRLERLYTWSPWCAGLSGHHGDNALGRIALDTSIGVSGPHDFAVRNDPFVRAAQSHAATRCAHRIPPPTSRDGRDTPLRRKQDGTRYT
ncbi:conserved hypothetical protein [Bradyrhizobium sp. ORS 375]|nr:conserved hypothetical protein [Bradyrhizobium sp. ORS 375]